MSDRAASSPDRSNNIDALRLLMALLVILAHAYPLSVRGAADPLAAWTRGRLGLGGVAVLAFFAISGYLIAASADRAPSLRDFLARRVRRIYPGYFVALATCAFVVSPLSSNAPVDVPRRIAKFAIWATLLNAWSDGHAFAHNAMPEVVNGSLWTIQQEFACYLMLAMIMWIGGRRSAVGVLGVGGALYLLHVARCTGALSVRDLHVGIIYVSPGSFLLTASCFFAGSVAYVLRDRLRFRPSIAAACVVVVGVSSRLPVDFTQVLLPIALPYVVFTIAFARCRATEGFATRVGGDYSYGVYLYAFPIQQIVTARFGGAMSPLLNFAIALPLALVCGIASWHGVEKHFVRRDRRERRATIVPDDAAAGRASVEDLGVQTRVD